MLGQDGLLIVLTCISFFNELRFLLIKGGDIHSRTSFVMLCNAPIKKNGQSPTTYTLHLHTDIFRWKAKINLHARLTLKLTIFMQISCLMRSDRHLVF